jgi:hypothetical protein
VCARECERHDSAEPAGQLAGGGLVLAVVDKSRVGDVRDARVGGEEVGHVLGVLALPL